MKQKPSWTHRRGTNSDSQHIQCRRWVQEPVRPRIANRHQRLPDGPCWRCGPHARTHARRVMRTGEAWKWLSHGRRISESVFPCPCEVREWGKEVSMVVSATKSSDENVPAVSPFD